MLWWDASLGQIVCKSVKEIRSYRANKILHCYLDKPTRSPKISRQQVQKLTPQFVFFIYIGYRFPLSLSNIVFLKKKNYLFPECFFLEMFEIKNQNKGIEDYRFPLSLSTIWRNHLPFNQELKGGGGGCRFFVCGGGGVTLKSAPSLTGLHHIFLFLFFFKCWK